MRIVAAIGLMVAAGWCAGCGGKTEALPEDTGSIQVNGIGQIEVFPDMVSVHLGIEALDKDPVKSQAENDRKVAALLVAIKELGIADADVKTGCVSLAPKETEQGGDKPPVFEGYEAYTDVVVVVRDLSRYNPLVTGALKAGVTRVSDLEFDYSKAQETRRQSRILAVRAARQKAEDLAGELGRKIGEPISISEHEDYERYSGRGGASLFASVSDGGAPATLTPGRAYIRSDADVTFALEK